MEKKQLINNFIEILEELTPKVETNADANNLTVKLEFDKKKLDRDMMRNLGAVMVDRVL